MVSRDGILKAVPPQKLTLDARLEAVTERLERAEAMLASLQPPQPKPRPELHVVTGEGRESDG